MPEPPPEPSTPTVRTYLSWALVATVLCFLPLGLVALYFGLRVNGAIAGGRRDDAARYSRIARRWLVATVLVGALIYAIVVIVFALLGAYSP